MLKKLQPLLVSFILLSVSNLVSAENNQLNHEQKIKKLVSERINIEVVNNKSIIQSFVFDCQFYSATPYLMSSDGGESSSESFLYYQQGDTLALMTSPTTTEPLPELSFCLKDNFVVTNQEQAQLLFEAIESVYPSSSMFDDRFEKKLVKASNGWIYINGEFFDDKKGYRVETTAEGKVIQIIHSLSL
ncbi:hypothetical protein L4C33_14685 [Vibrio makurazakiensis]|uniref:hypothetical protein n=1 Tax=Vibrio makurazakiensis TaxID=2910250 RepID=UPI003D0CF66C